MKSTK